MTTTSEPQITIPPISSNDSLIVKAASGINQDWDVAKGEFNARLEEILHAWSCADASPYTTQIASFPAPPHTVQRLAELLRDPCAWYTSLAKFIRALVRVLSVTSTTVDYSEEKEPGHVTHEDSLLVPIPWLTLDDERAGDFDPVARIDAGSSTTTTTTTMSNGVRFIVHGGRGDENGVLAEGNGTSVAPLSGAAPMDATDYGPQSEDVKEAIAMNGHAAHISLETAAPAETANGTIDEMDTTT